MTHARRTALASDGRVSGADQRISLDRAVTLDAARSLGLEAEIGSIEPGKRADFTVLERDPHEVDPHELEDIEVSGTVLDGVPRPLPTSL